MTLPIPSTVFADGERITGATWYARILAPINAWLARLAGDADWNSLPLSGAWVIFGSSYTVPGYRSRNGVVNVTGLVKNGAVGPIASVPAAIAPASTMSYLCFSNLGAARVDVTPDGAISLIAYLNGGSNASVSLDNVQWVNP